MDVHALHTSRAAYATVRPHPDYLDSWVQESVTPETLVLTWGTLEESHRVASRVRAQFGRAGAQGVAELPGRFAALIAELRTGRVWLTSSLLASTHLHYVLAGAELWVSPHDICLVAAGKSEGRVRPGRCASALLGAPGSSSLLQDVHRVSAQHAICWQRGEAVERHRIESFTLAKRVSLRPRHGVREKRAQVEAAVSQRLHALLPPYGESVGVEVDASPDGLACWALTHGLSPRRPMTVVSRTGDAAGQAIARRAALLQGVPLACLSHEPRSATGFERDSRLLAFFGNGQGSAKHLLQAECRVVSGAQRVRFSSEAASLFSGTLYGQAGTLWPLPAQPAALADRLLRGLSHVLPAPSPYASAVHAELTESLEQLSQWSRNPYDLLNLAQLFLRLGRNSLAGQLPWLPLDSPFESVIAVKLAFQLPPPIGAHCDLPRWLIRKHLPSSLQPPRRGHPWARMPLNLPGMRWLSRTAARARGGTEYGALSEDALDLEFRRGLLNDFTPCVEDLLSDGQSLLEEWLGQQTATAMRQSLAGQAYRKSRVQRSAGASRALVARAVPLLQWCRLCSEVRPP